MSRFLQRFSKGFFSVFQGWSLIRANPSWWRFVLIPILIQLTLSTACIIIVNLWAADFIRHLVEGWRYEWLETAMRVLLHILIFISSCIAAGVLWLALSGILCPFFYGRLAKKVELSLGTSADELRDLSVAEEVSEAVIVFLQLGGMEIALYLIAFFPVFGSLVAFVGGWYVAAWKLGSEVFDYPLAIRGMNRKQKQAYRRLYEPEILGIGTIVIAIASVPVLGSILLVPCVIGAIALHSASLQHMHSTQP